MPKRKTRKKKRKVTTSTSKRIVQSNPRKKRSISSRTRGLLTGLKPQQALVGAVKQTGGMLLAQFFAKKFAGGGGANDPDWGYKNYLLGTAGAFAAGITAEMVKRGSGHEFLKGGLSLIAYKIFVNEIAPQNSFLEANFGEEDGDFLEISPEYGAEEMDVDMLLGDDGDEYIMGEDGIYDDVDDDDDVDVLLGDELSPVGPLGDVLSPVGPMGDDPFARVLGGNNSDLDVAMYSASQA